MVQRDGFDSRVDFCEEQKGMNWVAVISVVDGDGRTERLVFSKVKYEARWALLSARVAVAFLFAAGAWLVARAFGVEVMNPPAVQCFFGVGLAVLAACNAYTTYLGDELGRILSRLLLVSKCSRDKDVAEKAQKALKAVLINLPERYYATYSHLFEQYVAEAPSDAMML